MKSPPNHVSLSDTFVSRIEVTKPTRFWDHGSKAQPGLVLVALPSGSRTYYCYYTLAERKRWLRLGDGISVAAARYAALGVRNDVVRTNADPVAQRQIARSSGTVAELIAAYVADLRAQGKRSARYTERLLQGRILKRWGKQPAGAITRADVRVLAASMADVPVMANAVLAAVSGMYTWAIANDFEGLPPNHANPTAGVARNVARERERVASNDELRRLWPHLPPVLRLVLLTGCRPGEALNLRSCDLKDGWWCQPGEPAGRWRGTKNKKPHDVYITPAIAGIIEEVADKHYRERTVAGQMEGACKAAGITDPIKPHDLRRTWATRCTGAGHTTEQMDRCLNHVRRGRGARVSRVYDRHVYRLENIAIWLKVAGAIMAVIEGKGADVVALSDARNAS
jgi:integrase